MIEIVEIIGLVALIGLVVSMLAALGIFIWTLVKMMKGE